MRRYTPFVLLLHTLVSGSLLRRAAPADDASPSLSAQPASTPAPQAPVATLIVDSDVLEFPRDVQAFNTASAATAAPSITTIPPSSTTSGLEWGIQSEYTTTQWIETYINSTSRTWVPKTITMHFRSMSPGPAPGKGEIGMGTLASGNVGQTEVIVVGAAPTQAVGWGVGVGVVAGLLGGVV